MPFQPDVSDVHIDRLLTNISIGTLNDPADYIATQVFPAIQVNKQSDLIPVYDEFAWLEDAAQVRAPATESEGSGWTLSNQRYVCENYAFHKDVPVETRANADQPYNLDEEAALYTVDRMLMKMEVKFASDFFITGKWTTNLDLTGGGQTQWTTVSSDIFGEVETAKQTVSLATTKDPNVMIVGRNVWGGMIQNTGLLNRMKTTSDKWMNRQLVQTALDLDKLLVAKAIKATNKEGQTLAKGRILAQNALLVYVTPRPSLMTPNGGYTFYWTALGAGIPVYTRRLNMPLKLADRIESHIYYDSRLTSANAGYMFVSAAN